MEIIEAIITSFVSFFVLFFLSKLMGNREMSQLSMFDYINGITIGSIAAEMATAMFTDVTRPLVAMIVYTLLIILFAIITDKSIRARRFISGKPKILYHRGIFYYNNLKHARIDIEEFLTQCRVNGYFDLSAIHTAILESNGQISFLPTVSDRPVTPSDLKLSPKQEALTISVLFDGRIIEDNLVYAEKDKGWLIKELEKKGFTNLDELLLVTCDCNQKLSVYKKSYSTKAFDFLS